MTLFAANQPPTVKPTSTVFAYLQRGRKGLVKYTVLHFASRGWRVFMGLFWSQVRLKRRNTYQICSASSPFVQCYPQRISEIREPRLSGSIYTISEWSVEFKGKLRKRSFNIVLIFIVEKIVRHPGPLPSRKGPHMGRPRQLGRSRDEGPRSGPTLVHVHAIPCRRLEMAGPA